MKIKVVSYTLFACLLLWSCNKKENISTQTNESSQNTEVTAEPQSQTSEIDWNQAPELTSIGDFPFITAPDGINIYDFEEDGQPKDGITTVFPFKKFEVYNGNGVSSVEGKLAVLYFIEDISNGFKYDQYIFDRNMQDYFKRIGVKLLYQGNMPDDENIKAKLKENMYSGKYHTYGISDDSPFSVYAFKNNGKKYVVNVQSNSASATIFIVELKDFEQSITA